MRYHQGPASSLRAAENGDDACDAMRNGNETNNSPSSKGEINK
jgi:hypothetical protein